MDRSLFAEADFYRFPLNWLAEIKDASDLDARDLLLAHTVEGKIIFADEQGEQTWFTYDDGTRRRGLFTRQTFSKHKNALLRRRWLRKYQRPPRSHQTTAVAYRDLHQSIKYELMEWSSQAAVLYRPRGYLQNRWPVWLGNADLGSRGVLAALLAALNWVDNQTQVTLTWREIQAFVARHFTHSTSHEANPLSLAKLRKGVQELQILGLIEETAGATLCYTLHLTRFAAAPLWSLSLLAQVCQDAGAHDELWLRLLADLMTHCCEPVTRLQTVWQTLCRYRTSPYLMDETDVADLRNYMQWQGQHGPLLRHEQLLAGFIQTCAQHQPRLCSEGFVLPASATALARQTIQATSILLPAPSTRPVAATQLCLQWRRSADMTVVEAQHVLAGIRLIVWQERVGQAPVAVPLISLPIPTNPDVGYTVYVDAVPQVFDYAYPVEVWLKCDQPDARLQLRGCFRFLLAK